MNYTTGNKTKIKICRITTEIDCKQFGADLSHGATDRWEHRKKKRKPEGKSAKPSGA